MRLACAVFPVKGAWAGEEKGVVHGGVIPSKNLKRTEAVTGLHSKQVGKEAEPPFQWRLIKSTIFVKVGILRKGVSQKSKPRRVGELLVYR